MSRIMSVSAGIFLLGISFGFVSGRWETSGDIVPPIRATNVVNQPAAVNNSNTGTGGAKAVVVNGESHDFGTMEKNTKKSHTFLIRNDGRIPLKLEKGQTSCKCTLSNVSDHHLPAGETAEVKLTWEAKTDEPEFSQSAEIRTNDPDRPLLRLVVRGLVLQAVRPDRRELAFHQVTLEESATATMRIFGYLSDELTVVKHEFAFPESADKFDVKFRPLTAEEVKTEAGARAGVELSVTLKPGLPLGTVSQTLRLTLQRPEESTLEIPFHGRVISDISLAGARTNAESNSISLGTFARGDKGSLTCFLMVKGPHRDGLEIKLKEVVPSDRLRANLGEPIRDNPKIVRIPLTVELLENAPPGNYFGATQGADDTDTGVLSLTTNHPQIPELKIKVRFLVKD